MNSGTRTEQFINLVSELRLSQFNDVRDRFIPPGTVQAYVPRSGITMEFDSDAQCVSGCP